MLRISLLFSLSLSLSPLWAGEIVLVSRPFIFDRTKPLGEQFGADAEFEGANPGADDLYQRLGVSRQASVEEIQRAYRKLVKKLHPDIFNNSPREEYLRAERDFKRVDEAYGVLRDSDKRSRYDRGERNFSQTSSNYDPDEIAENLICQMMLTIPDPINRAAFIENIAPQARTSKRIRETLVIILNGRPVNYDGVQRFFEHIPRMAAAFVLESVIDDHSELLKLFSPFIQSSAENFTVQLELIQLLGRRAGNLNVLNFLKSLVETHRNYPIYAYSHPNQNEVLVKALTAVEAMGLAIHQPSIADELIGIAKDWWSRDLHIAAIAHAESVIATDIRFRELVLNRIQENGAWSDFETQVVALRQLGPIHREPEVRKIMDAAVDESLRYQKGYLMGLAAAISDPDMIARKQWTKNLVYQLSRIFIDSGDGELFFSFCKALGGKLESTELWEVFDLIYTQVGRYAFARPIKLEIEAALQRAVADPVRVHHVRLRMAETPRFYLSLTAQGFMPKDSKNCAEAASAAGSTSSR